MLQEDEKRVRPTYSVGGLNQLEIYHARVLKLVKHDERAMPGYPTDDISNLDYWYNEAVMFFKAASKEAETLLSDLYEYSPEIRKLIDEKGRPDDKFRSFKFTAEIEFDNDEGFFDFTLFGNELSWSRRFVKIGRLVNSRRLVKEGYWTGEEGWRLTLDFDKADDALRAIVRDIEAFENDEEHKKVSVEAFDLVRTAIHGILKS